VTDELGNIRAMEPIRQTAVTDRDDFVYQVKWDGVRIMAGITNGRVCLLNKKGRERTLQYPELQKLPGLLQADRAILDGEIVVMKNDRPHFPAVMQRDRAQLPNTIKLLAQTLPIEYMVFDLLSLNNQDLRKLPLLERVAKLEKVFADQAQLHHVPCFLQGSSLLAAVQEAGMEGIVAKRKNSAYHPARQHNDWFKIKCSQSQKCMVGGYTLHGQKVNSLLLGVYRDDQLCYIGKAANGLREEHWQTLSRELPALETKRSPFAGPVPKEAHFIEPRLAVLVEFLEWTEAMQLRFPVIQAFITANAADCRI